MQGRRSNFDPADLIQRYLDGESMMTLCKRYHTDRSTIHSVFAQHGIKPRGRIEAVQLAIMRTVDSPELIRRYHTGESVHSLGQAFGIDPYVVRRILGENGIKPRGQSDAARLKRVVPDDEAEIIRRYLSGESIKSLRDFYGVAERCISRVLDEHGITRRTIKEANNLAHERLTPTQRLTRATRHAVVWEGRTYPRIPVSRPEWLQKKALTQQRTLAMQRPEELDLRKLLPAGWVDGEQVAVDRYNIDFTHGTVAVEVHSSGLHPFRSEQNVTRSIDLAELGWHVIYFWPNSGARRITDRGVTELVAHAKRLDGDPALWREYVVVRGGGETVTAGCFDLEQRSLIPTPVDSPEATDGPDSRIAS